MVSSACVSPWAMPCRRTLRGTLPFISICRCCVRGCSTLTFHFAPLASRVAESNAVGWKHCSSLHQPLFLALASSVLAPRLLPSLSKPTKSEQNFLWRLANLPPSSPPPMAEGLLDALTAVWSTQRTTRRRTRKRNDGVVIIFQPVNTLDHHPQLAVTSAACCSAAWRCGGV